MCGQFYVEIEHEELDKIIAEINRNVQNAGAGVAAISANFHEGTIKPTNVAPVLALDHSKPKYMMQKFGFPGFGDKHRGHINARSKTVASLPTFGESFAQRRCVIPASGFYEWRRIDKTHKQQYAITEDGSVIYMAGIWKCFPVGDIAYPHFVIITQDASPSMRFIHDRMPVLMHEDEQEEYMTDRKFADHLMTRKSPEIHYTEIMRPNDQLTFL